MKFSKKALTYVICGLAMAGLAYPLQAKDLIGKKTSNWNKPFTVKIKIAKGKNITVDYRKGAFTAIDAKGKKTLIMDDLDSLDVLNKEVVVSIADFNFDGYKDVAFDVSYGYAGVNIVASVYLWDKAKNRFTKEGFEASNIKLDDGAEVLVSSQRSGPRWYHSEYKFDKLKAWKYHETIGPGLVEIHTYFDKTGKVVKKIIADTVTVTETPQPAVFTVKLDRIYLYSKPNENAKTTSYIVKGDKVTIIDEAGPWTEWFKIRYKGKKTIERWVQSKDFDTEE